MVSMNMPFEACFIELSHLRSRHSAAILLQLELLLSNSTNVLKLNSPVTSNLSSLSLWHHWIFIVTRMRKSFIDRIGDDTVFARSHHVRHDDDGTRHRVRAFTRGTRNQNPRRTFIELLRQLCSGDLQLLCIPLNA